MRDEVVRDLTILSSIAESDRLTQRDLARKLAMPVSLVNLYVRRFVAKGFVRIIGLRPNRLRYLLTPKGFAEKSRLVHASLCRAFEQYRQARVALRESLSSLRHERPGRIAFYGVGEAAEVAYLCLKEVGLEPDAVFDASDGTEFLGMSVQRPEEIVPAEFDRIVVTAFDTPEGTEAKVEELVRLGVSRERIVILRRDERPLDRSAVRGRRT
jgi:DNA-binding MarR family transcriptional regulator